MTETIKLEIGYMEDGAREVDTLENVTAMYKEISNSDFNDVMLVIEYIQINDEIGRTHYWIDELNYIKDAESDHYFFAKSDDDIEC